MQEDKLAKSRRLLQEYLANTPKDVLKKQADKWNEINKRIKQNRKMIDELIKKYGYIRDEKLAYNMETEEFDIIADYSKVWDATIQMLEDLYSHNCHLHAPRLQPRIYPGPNVSLDVLWEKEDSTLLVNVANNGEYATFYGDKKVDKKIVYYYEGQFKLPEHCEFLHIPSE